MTKKFKLLRLGADNRTCKDERSEDGIANAVRECRDMDISRHVSVTISDDPVVRRGRKRAEIAKKYEAVKQPHIFRRKGESSVGGADNRT